MAFFTSSWNLVPNYRNLVHFVYNHLFGIRTYQPVSSRWWEVGLLIIINMQQNHSLEQSKGDYHHKGGIALSWNEAVHVHKPVNHGKVFCAQRMTIVMYRNRESKSKRWLETSYTINSEVRILTVASNTVRWQHKNNELTAWLYILLRARNFTWLLLPVMQLADTSNS